MFSGNDQIKSCVIFYSYKLFLAVLLVLKNLYQSGS